MKTRIITGLVGIALLLGVIVKGGILFTTAILLISLIGIYEYDKAMSNNKEKILPSYANYLLAIALFILEVIGRGNYFQLALYGYIFIVLIQFLFSKKISVRDTSVVVFGGIYVVFLISHIYHFKNSIFIWYIFITSWGSDTFAYFIGKFFGKKKLWPEVSPNKTIIGSLGGLLGAVVLSVALSIYLDVEKIYLITTIVLVGAAISQMGDLIASKIKREVKIKDYGNIMPGHGGVLDRFDSIIFTTPFVYYMFKFIGVI